MISDDQIDGFIERFIDLPTGERDDAIRSACGTDERLRAAIEARLGEYDRAAGYFRLLQETFPFSPLSDVLDDLDRSDPLGLIGTEISHFRIEEYLGGGGMGLVYRARDKTMRRDVALKFLPPQIARSASSHQRFKREASAVSSLDHANIATLYEIGETSDGQLFIAMAYYDGETLKDKIVRGPLPIERVVYYAHGICSALMEAHAHGIIHRDVKPANVMITKAGKVKLLDFGVAKVTDLSSLTDSDSTLGTAAYMAPEQARGEDISPGTDLWALGVTMYEMLTGEQPFRGSYAVAIVYRICNEEPADLVSLREDVPPELAALVRHCMEKEPDRRANSAAVVLETLREIQRPFLGETSVAPARLLPSWKVASPAVLLLTALVAVILWLIPPEPTGISVMFDGMSLAILPPQAEAGSDNAVPESVLNAALVTLSEAGARLDYSIDDLFVVPEEDVFINGVATASDARANLGVSHVLETSVRPSSGGYDFVLTLLDDDDSREASGTVHYSTAGGPMVFESFVSALGDVLDMPLDTTAIRLASTGGTRNPTAWEHYSLARDLLNEFEDPERLETAIRLLNLATEADSDFAQAYSTLGEAYMWQFRATADTSAFTMASSAGRRAIALGDNLATAHATLGTILKEQGLLDEAEAEFLRAARQDPRLASAEEGLYLVYRLQGRPEEALSAIRKAISIRPGYWLYHSRLGQYYLWQGEFDEAIRTFKQTIQVQPRNPWGYNNLGAAYHRSENLDEALVQYELAASVNPRVPRAIGHALMNIGGIHYTRGEYGQAARAYRRAAMVDSTEIDLWDKQGNMYALANQPDSARASWARVLERAETMLRINPERVLMLEYAAEAHAKLGEKTEAIEVAMRLEPLADRNASAPVTLATVYELIGDRDRALEFVDLALQNPWSHPSIASSIWLEDLRADPRYIAMRSAAEILVQTPPS